MGTDAATHSPVRLMTTRRFEDDRGWFVETWNEQRWTERGVDADFVQDNHSLSRTVGTIRGIHFQLPPRAQGKLVRCVRGSIVDYAIDLRAGSPTFGHHVAAELTGENGLQLWIPAGFGHAFVTMAPDTEVAYKVTALYDGSLDAGLHWQCPELAIAWPLPLQGATLSEKDRQLPCLAQFVSPFEYDGRPLAELDV